MTDTEMEKSVYGMWNIWKKENNKEDKDITEKDIRKFQREVVKIIRFGVHSLYERFY